MRLTKPGMRVFEWAYDQSSSYTKGPADTLSICLLSFCSYIPFTAIARVFDVQ